MVAPTSSPLILIALSFDFYSYGLDPDARYSGQNKAREYFSCVVGFYRNILFYLLHSVRSDQKFLSFYYSPLILIKSHYKCRLAISQYCLLLLPVQSIMYSWYSCGNCQCSVLTLPHIRLLTMGLHIHPYNTILTLLNPNLELFLYSFSVSVLIIDYPPEINKKSNPCTNTVPINRRLQQIWLT